MSPSSSSPTEAVHPRLSHQRAPSLAEFFHAMHEENARAAAAAAKANAAVVRATGLIAKAFTRGGRLIYVGAGTSGRLGVLDASECPPTFGSPPGQVMGIIAGGERALRESIEGAEDDTRAAQADLKQLKLNARDVVCGISASGRAAYVISALAFARKKGARTVFVTCNPAAAKAPRATVAIALSTGAEIVAGSTRLKAGTATKMVLNALTTGAFFLLGRVQQGEMIGVQPKNQKLKLRAERIVGRLTGLSPAQARALLIATRYQVDAALARHAEGAR